MKLSIKLYILQHLEHIYSSFETGCKWKILKQKSHYQGLFLDLSTSQPEQVEQINDLHIKH